MPPRSSCIDTAQAEAERRGIPRPVLDAVARDDMFGLLNVTVTVNDEPTLDAQVTRWLSPVSGNWTDPSKWSAGVPGVNQIAVINAAGLAYTVTLNADINCRALVVDSSYAYLTGRSAG